MPRQEEARERQDVLAARAQRLDCDRDDVEPEVEVLAEAAGGDGIAEVAVGGGHHAHVDVPRLRRAHSLHLAVLEHAQQLGLELGRDLADLVEEERAAVGALEAAGAGLERSGERAALVAEELALEHAGRERRAVHGDERRADAVAPVVQQPRDELLARPALTLYQDARRRPRHPPHQLEQIAARRALGDHRLGRVGGGLLAQPRVLALEPHQLDRSRHLRPDLVVVERLGDVVEGAGAHRLHRRGTSA